VGNERKRGSKQEPRTSLRKKHLLIPAFCRKKDPKKEFRKVQNTGNQLIPTPKKGKSHRWRGLSKRKMFRFSP